MPFPGRECQRAGNACESVELSNQQREENNGQRDRDGDDNDLWIAAASRQQDMPLASGSLPIEAGQIRLPRLAAFNHQPLEDVTEAALRRIQPAAVRAGIVEPAPPRIVEARSGREVLREPVDFP
jgi:hypothetical protein